MLTILLTPYIIMLIIPLLYIAANTYHKRYTKMRASAKRQYREHIDNLVNELFPPATHASDLHASDPQEATVQEAIVQYQETKRKMIADIRKYFNQRKMKIETTPSGVEIPDLPDPDTLYLK